MSDLIERARQLRTTIEQLTDNLTDEDAVESKELFPKWSETGSYSIGMRVRYNDKLYKVLQQHSAQLEWNPIDAPALFAEILPGQDGTEIGEWVQPDSTNPYMKGNRVLYNGNTYESLVDNNVWVPTTPNVWTLVE